jgi:hypothetical protein
MSSGLVCDEPREWKDLIASTIDFTKTFRALAYELVISIMRQLNFSEWTQVVVADMYNGAR